MVTIPRGIRNHNPGNLVYVETIQWQGQTGHDGRFCTFDSADNGIRALCKQLLAYQDKYGLRTIRAIISRWAPPSENDTEAYIRAVAHFMVTAEGDLLELHNDTVLTALATAIITHENGQQPYAADLIRNAAHRALGWAFVPEIEPVDVHANDTHTATQPAAPIVDHSPDPATLPPVKPKEPTMAPFIPMLLSAILPAIPELVGIFGKSGEKAERNVKAAQAVVDVTTKALGVVNEQQAIETLAAAPERMAEVKAAVLADPTIAALIEVGGGVKEARSFDLAQQAQPKPFWKTSAVFWISVLLLPLVYWFVGSVIVGGVDAGDSTFLKLFGTSWTGESRAGIANLVIGLVLGGICGVYYGISVTQQRANSTDRSQ